MRGYELVFITDPEINDKDLKVLLSKFKKNLKDSGGKLVHEHVWGIRKLAYEIKSNEYGMYHVWYFSGSGKTVDELQRQLGYSDNILRNQTVKVSDLDIEKNFFNELTKPKEKSEENKNDHGDSENFTGEELEVDENLIDGKKESENDLAKV